MSLTSVLPQEVLETARQTVSLQEALMSITDESLSGVVDLVMSLPFIRTFEGVMTLTNNILLAVKYRPFNKCIVARLTRRLMALAAPDNRLGDIKAFLLKLPPKVPDEK